MDEIDLDDVDRGILYYLQENARHTLTDIADGVGVTDNTVRNRLERLEEEGVIEGYGAVVDYARADSHIDYLFECTARISDREAYADRALEIDGVVEVREVMSGNRNVHVRIVGKDPDDITRIAHALDEIGLAIEAENLLRNQRRQPLSHFRPTDQE